MTDESKAERFNVKMPDGFAFKLNEAGTITELSAPEMKFDKWRETHVDYSESRTVKAVSIETYLTFDELVAIVRELRGEGGRE